MKPKCKKTQTLFHRFNGDNKISGPMLIIEAVTNENGEVIIAHKWHSTGAQPKMATQQEMKALCHFLMDQKDDVTQLFSHYILQIM